MKLLFSLIAVILSSSAVFSQHDLASTNTYYQALAPTTPNEPAWVKPIFPGGQAKMMAFITDGIRYPELAQENSIEGAVVVRLSLSAEGKVTRVETLRSVGFGCDKAVLARIEKLPAFKPGLHYGRGVESTVIIPVKFRLR